MKFFVVLGKGRGGPRVGEGKENSVQIASRLIMSLSICISFNK